MRWTDERQRLFPAVMLLREKIWCRGRFGSTVELVPGLLLTTMLAALAFSLHRLSVLNIFSPMILAILLGMAFQNVIGTTSRAQLGIAFSTRRLLRLGIMLLGFQLTLSQLVEVGFDGLAIIMIAVTSTFFFTKAIGRWLGVDEKLTDLIAAGTSICGASAVIATNAIVRGRDEDVCYAVACVTLFGSIAMFIYPLAGVVLQMSARDYGLWTGASVHEIAQVVGAAFQHGIEAGQAGTIVKLTRVLMLAPMMLLLSWVSMRHLAVQSHGKSGAVTVPWFVLGFLAIVGVNSAISIDPTIRAVIVQFTNFLLTMALAGLGLGADLRKLVAAGSRPLLLGGCAALFIASVSLALVVLAL